MSWRSYLNLSSVVDEYVRPTKGQALLDAPDYSICIISSLDSVYKKTLGSTRNIKRTAPEVSSATSAYTGCFLSVA